MDDAFTLAKVAIELDLLDIAVRFALFPPQYARVIDSYITTLGNNMKHDLLGYAHWFTRIIIANGFCGRKCFCRMPSQLPN